MEVWAAVITATAGIATALITAFARRRPERSSGGRRGSLAVMWTSVVIAVVSLGALVWVLVVRSGGDARVEITHPEDSSEVRQVLVLRGSSSSISADSSIWVVLYSADVDRYYPHDDPATIEAGGAWSSPAHIGSPTDAGREFELLAIVAAPSAQDAFRDYLTEAADAGSWEGLDRLPEGAEIYDRITVTRR